MKKLFRFLGFEVLKNKTIDGLRAENDRLRKFEMGLNGCISYKDHVVFYDGLISLLSKVRGKLDMMNRVAKQTMKPTVGNYKLATEKHKIRSKLN